MARFLEVASYRNTIYTRHFPTGTWLEVKGLVLPEFMIEIELEAHKSNWADTERGDMSFHLREARTADIRALAALHVQTFNETHRRGRPGGPSYELRERQWREAFERQDGSWFCFVIEDDRGELVGFAKGTPHDGGVPRYAAELDKIYVLQRVQRQGLGRVLLCAVARQFMARGVSSMLLFGDAASPSNGFYEAFGAVRLHSPSGEFNGGYGWQDLSTLVRQGCGE